MRCLISILVALMALPVAAGDGFTLGLAEMDFSAETEEAGPSRILGALEADEPDPEYNESLVYQAALIPRSANERTLALWNSDFGRLYYELAAQQSMLGREGLVNGGRMAGLGLATAGIGDSDPNGALGLALGRGKWAEMNANQKLQAGVEASFLAALLYFMVQYAD